MLRFAPPLLLLLIATSCARVAPHQRGRLAHPSVQAEDGSSPGREHVHAIQEGATGGSDGAVSGCGCN